MGLKRVIFVYVNFLAARGPVSRFPLPTASSRYAGFQALEGDPLRSPPLALIKMGRLFLCGRGGLVVDGAGEHSGFGDEDEGEDREDDDDGDKNSHEEEGFFAGFTVVLFEVLGDGRDGFFGHTIIIYYGVLNDK